MDLGSEHHFDRGFLAGYSLRAVLLFPILCVVPNLLGMVNFLNLNGFKIHFFQYGIFLAAVGYGPLGGLAAGFCGSIFSAYILSNPYIIVGNGLLGFFTGFFYRRGNSLAKSVGFAFCIQLPWLVYSDIFLAAMPSYAVGLVVVSLAVSNMILSLLALWTKDYLMPWTK